MINQPPKRDEDTCQETICFGDDFGDNHCTFYCLLPKGHDGMHKEKGDQYGKPYTLTWSDQK